MTTEEKVAFASAVDLLRIKRIEAPEAGLGETERALLSAADVPMFLVGLFFSFVSAWLCVRWLLRYISTHSFVPFAYYRIVFGIIVLVTAWSGWVQWAD